MRRALAVLLALACAGSALADQPVATAKIAEWAASSRGGKADYKELSHGRPIDIAALVVPGKVTIVDFSSDYCAPCVDLAMFLIQASKSHPDRYAIRRVDINRPGFRGIDYQSPVSIQYSVRDLPKMVIFEKGARVAEGDAAREWLIGDLKKLEPAQ